MTDNGSPIQNASVTTKGNKIDTTIKVHGVYSISARLNVDTLVISSPGFITQELPITSGTSSFDISLKRVPEIVLDEVIIVGDTAEVIADTAEIILDGIEIVVDQVVVPYGSAKRQTFTGSAGEINAKQFGTRALTNITSAIEGLIPGVITTAANGQPGSGPNIRVRGFGSINASSEPLLVVDGVPYIGNSSNINPADVENITVLKDAAASALYGSRAGNGVVMITTKKGVKESNGISLRVTQGYTTRGLPEYDRLDALQYYPIMWEAYRNSLVYPTSGTGISFDSANRVASGLTNRTNIQDLLSYNPFNVANSAIVGTNGELNPNAQLLYADDLDWTKELCEGDRAMIILSILTEAAITLIIIFHWAM